MRFLTTLFIALPICGLASCTRTTQDATSANRPLPATGAQGSEGTPKTEPDSTPGRVTLSPEVQGRLGVVVRPMKEVPLTIVLQAAGSVQPIDSRVAHVSPLARGRIGDVAVKIGDRVEQGQVLASFDNIDAGELATQDDAARSELARLQAQLTTASRQTERSRKLADIGAVPQREYEAALSEQRQLEASVQGQQATITGLEGRLRRYGVSSGVDPASVSIRSPFAGVVMRVTAAPGQVVDPSSELFAIADISRVYVQAQVYETDLGRVRVGQPAAVTVDAYPDERFTGRVATVGDSVDPQTRTIAVRCELENTARRLKLDMLAKVDLETTAAAPALAVPSDAIQTYEGKHIVFVRSGTSQFDVRAVDLGRVASGLTEVTSGLKAGDAVVIGGAFQVKSALLSKSLGEKDKG